MKLFFVAILLCLLCNNIINAQVKYSILAGANLNNTLFKANDISPKSKTKATIGFHLGIVRKYNIEDNIIFATGLIGALKGYEVNRGLVDTAKINTQYFNVEIPVLIQFNLGKGETAPYVALGPSLGFNLNGKDKVTKANGSVVKTNMVWGYTDYARYEGNINIIFGVRTKIGFFVEARYMHGLGTIYNADDSYIIKPRVANLTLGYTINRVKKLAFEK